MSEPTSARAPGPDDPFEVVAGGWHRHTTLRDGTRILLRQIRPEDRDRLVQGLQELSADSRYLRFHADVTELSERQLDYLTDVDHLDHEAIVALDRDVPDVPGIGVARYIRDPYERHVAEAAVTVADAYHGRGAGTILLGALSARAREHGIDVFRNYVLASNEAMLEVFDGLGAVREPENDRLWRVDLALPDHDDDLPGSPAGRAFLAAAKGGHRLTSLLPPIWPRRSAREPAARTTVASIDEELQGLREELGPWLLDRDRRQIGWPIDGPSGPAEESNDTPTSEDTRTSSTDEKG